MDEQNEQQPISEPAAEVVPEKPKKKGRKGSLENLPADVKADMENFMRSKTINATPKYMREKYGEKFPALVDVTTGSYYLYYKRHNVEIIQEIALQKASIATPPELLTLIEKTTDESASLTDKRAAFIALYNDCAATSKMLDQKQTNFVDPQIQQVILNNRKQMCVIIEKLSVLNDQLTKESDIDWLNEAEILMQIFYGAVVNCYKLTHEDQSKFSSFMSTLTDHLTTLFTSYKATKEKFKKS